MRFKYGLPLVLGFSLITACAYAASDDDYLEAVKKCPVQAGSDRDQCLTDAIETRDRRKRAEQEDLVNRPATGTGVYRCVSGDGNVHTRDKQDIRLGEFCAELTREEAAKMKAEALKTPEGRKRAEQEELMNRPATGTGVYRCVSDDGRRHTRDKHDIRLGEFCGELTREEVAKMKAEANRPPTDSEKSSMTTRAKQMNHWDRCVELGRVLRQTNATPRQQYWADAVIAAAKVPGNDHGYIRERRVRIGMSECAVFAALGKPDAANSTHTAQGRSSQLVYRGKRMYIYTEKGVVRSWQD